MKKYLPNLVFLVLFGLAGYYLTLVAAPYAVLHVFEHRLLAKVPENTLFHAPLPAATPNTGTMPNPDFLYSVLKYNLSGGPVRLTGTVPHDTYWSFSTYQADSSNFSVVNDQQITASQFDIVLARAGEPLNGCHLSDATRVVYSPTTTGVGLFRLLVATPADLSRLEDLRHQTHVDILKP